MERSEYASVRSSQRYLDKLEKAEIRRKEYTEKFDKLKDYTDAQIREEFSDFAQYFKTLFFTAHLSVSR